MKRIPIKQLMTREVITVGADTSLADLVAVLWEHNLQSVPVVDDQRHLLGMVGEIDLFLKEKGLPFSLEKVPTLLGRPVAPEELDQFGRAKNVAVSEVMTTATWTVTEETTLEEAAMLMYERKVANLPVLREGRLVGIVSRCDILRVIYCAAGSSG
jgi:CBS domain-containing protein